MHLITPAETTTITAPPPSRVHARQCQRKLSCVRVVSAKCALYSQFGVSKDGPAAFSILALVLILWRLAFFKLQISFYIQRNINTDAYSWIQKKYLIKGGSRRALVQLGSPLFKLFFCCSCICSYFRTPAAEAAAAESSLLILNEVFGISRADFALKCIPYDAHSKENVISNQM